MPVTITALYAGILALVYFAMTMKVVRSRYRFRVSLGEGQNTEFQRIVRGHGNFSEYVPITLVLMALAEMSGASLWMLHAIGGSLLAGRLLHGWCFMVAGGNLKVRRAGMMLTMFPLVSGGLACLYAGLGV